MSMLFRTQEWLTLDQLVRGWAGELPGAHSDPQRLEADLAHQLFQDIANGRLDETGPLVEGRRLGLRLVTPDFQAGFLEGKQVVDLLRSGWDAQRLGHRIVVMKEAALAFAKIRRLPPPSWWHDTIDAPLAAPGNPAGAAAPSNSVSTPKRGRRSVRLDKVKQSMLEDIEQKRLTVPNLETMLEKEMEARYSVSRDTARRARDAVLSEFVDRQ
jgi:hypothetical protein